MPEKTEYFRGIRRSRVRRAVSLVFYFSGVTMFIGGLTMMLLSQVGAWNTVVESVSHSFLLGVGALPGVPFSVADLTGNGAAIIGLIIWVVGLDELLLGLGLWAGHKLALWIAVVLATLATFWCFTRFMLVGLLGSPESVIGLLVNSFLLYLLSKTDVWSRNGLLSRSM